MAWTLAQVKEWLKITVAEYDAQLTRLMARALDTVELELDWYFGTGEDVQEVLDGTGNRALWIRQPPLNTPVVYYRTDVGGTWAVLATDQYESEKRGFFHIANWTRGNRNYRIDYRQGFAEMPGDIEQLLLDLVSMKWNQRGSDPTIKSETIGDYSYTRADLEASEYWTAVVMRWRRGRI